MGRGKHKSLEQKRLNYLEAVIKKHEIDNLDDVLIKDWKLMRQFFGEKNKDALNSDYKRMIKWFISVGIILNESDSKSIPFKKAKTFTLSKDVLLKYIPNAGLILDSNYKENTGKAKYILDWAYNSNSVNSHPSSSSFVGQNRNKGKEKPLSSYKVKFSNGLRIPPRFSAEEISDAIYEKYNLNCGMEKIDAINKYYPSDQKIYFLPRIRKSATGLTTKISIRATNRYCKMYNFDHKDRHPYLKYEDSRQGILDELYGVGEEYDVKGSVPRVARLINYGIWEEDSVDPYFEMFGTFKWSNKTGDSEVRAFFKRVFMGAYFDGSPKQIVMHIRKTQPKEEIIRQLQSYSNEQLIYMFTDWKKRVSNYCGLDTGRNTEVFFHESCIYILVREELAHRGIDCQQVYDCFYFSDKAPEDIAQIIEASALYYYENFV